MEINQEITQKLDNYIHTEYTKGYTIDQIHAALVKAGYPEQLCKEMLKKYMNNPKIANPLLHKSQIIIAVILLAFIIGFIFYIKLISPVSCSTEQCFLEHANNCKASQYSVDSEGITFFFTTTNDCRVKKEVTAIPDTEPEQVKELLLGKNMECSYKKDNFNTDLLSTFVAGLDKCTGQLKEGIYELVLASG